MDEKKRKKTSIVIDPAVIEKIPRSITISEAIEQALVLWIEWRRTSLEGTPEQIHKWSKHEREHAMLDQVLDSGGDCANAGRAMLQALVRLANHQKGG